MKKYLLLLFLGSFLAVQAADTLKIRFGEVAGCPGQVFDVPVYFEGVKDAQKLSTISLAFYCTNNSVFEIVSTNWDTVRKMGTPVVTGLVREMAQLGPIGYNYMAVYEKETQYLPRMMFSWYDATGKSASFKPTSSLPVFHVRIRLKEGGKARFGFVPGYNTITSGISVNPMRYMLEIDTTTAIISNVKPPKVYAGADRSICAMTPLSLTGATGGVSYRWRGLNTWSAAAGVLSELNVQNPTFKGKANTMYRFEIRIADTTGCYAFDTLQVEAIKNTLRIQTFPDTIIDENGKVKLGVYAYHEDVDYITGKPIENTQGPFSYQWSPENVIENPKEAITWTKPLSNLHLLWVKVSDTNACTAEAAQRYNIRGHSFSGSINPFPVYRCGESETYEQTIQLNVLIKGGSGKYRYIWNGVNLDGGWAPTFSNPNMSNPMTTFYGRTAYEVWVQDELSNETYVLRDTVTILPYVGIDPKIRQDKQAFVCEDELKRFYASFENGGSNSQIHWYINDIRVLSAPNDTVFEPQNLKQGDRVRYVLYSDERCVQNSPKSSPEIKPDVRMWTSPRVNLNLVQENYTGCGDSYAVEAELFNAGSSFTIEVFRNDNKRLASQHMFSLPSGYVKVRMGNYTYLPENYFDKVYLRISSASGACLLENEAFSAPILPFAFSDKPVEVGAKIVSSALKDSLCEGTSVRYSLEGLRYLGDQRGVKVQWKKKSAGAAQWQVIKTYSYNSSSDIYPDFEAGFPIVFNQEDGPALLSGDTVYAIISTSNYCLPVGKYPSNMAWDSTDKKTLFFYDTGVLKLQMISQKQSYCQDELALMRTRVFCESEKGSYKIPAKSFTWYRNDNMVLNGVVKDSLYPARFIRADEKITCVVESDFACVQGLLDSITMVPEVTTLNLFVSKEVLRCKGDSALLKAWGDGVSYLWRSTGRVIGDSTNRDVWVSALSEDTTSAETAVYRVWARDVSGGCSKTDSVKVVWSPIPSMPEISLDVRAQEACEGDTVFFTATRQFADSIVWFVNDVFVKNERDIFAYVPQDGDRVFAMAVSTLRCAPVPELKSETFTVIRHAYPNVSIEGDSLICEGRVGEARASGASFYSWIVNARSTNSSLNLTKPKETSQLLENLGKGFYDVCLTAYDHASCKVFDTLKIEVREMHLNPEIDFIVSDTLVCGNNKLTLSATTMYADSVAFYRDNEFLGGMATFKSGDTFTKMMTEPVHEALYHATAFYAGACVQSATAAAGAVKIRHFHQPQMRIEALDRLCAGDDLTARAAGDENANLTWRLYALSVEAMEIPLQDSSAQSQTVADLVYGEYRFVLQSNFDPACPIEDTLNIEVLPTPAPMSVSFKSLPDSLCPNDPVKVFIRVQNASQAHWYGGDHLLKVSNIFSSTFTDSLNLYAKENDSLQIRLLSTQKCMESPVYSTWIKPDFSLCDKGDTIPVTPPIPPEGPFISVYELKIFTSEYGRAWADTNGVHLNHTVALDSGTKVRIVVLPDINAHFLYWEDFRTDSIRWVVIQKNTEVKAFFEKDTIPITPPEPPVDPEEPIISTFELNITSSEYGLVLADTNGVNIDHRVKLDSGTLVRIIALSDTNAHFLYWENNDTTSIRWHTLQKDTEVKAFFEKDTIAEEPPIPPVDPPIEPPVEEIDDALIFIPSAMAPLATNPKDRVLQVYGPKVKEVYLRVLNSQGQMVFNVKGDATLSWDGTESGKACPAGLYLYEAIVTTTEGKIVKKTGQITIIR